MEWFNRIVEFMGVPSPSRAILLAILGGLALTQWIKFQFPTHLSRRTTRLFSSVATAWLCFLLEPAMGSLGADGAVAVIVGLACPTLYWLAVKALYHFFPWMEDRLSACPTRREAP